MIPAYYLLIAITLYTVAFIIILKHHESERRDLLNRIMSEDLIQYSNFDKPAGKVRNTIKKGAEDDVRSE